MSRSLRERQCVDAVTRRRYRTARGAALHAVRTLHRLEPLSSPSRDTGDAGRAAGVAAGRERRDPRLCTPISRDGSLSVPRRGIAGWYLLARSDELRPGKVVARTLHGRELVLYRGRDSGTVSALAAHCAHMGTNLRNADVVGDEIRCPLHHWQFDAGGACTTTAGCAEGAAGSPPAWARQRSFPVREAHGAIFVFNGPKATVELPGWQGIADGDVAIAHAQAPELPVPWFVLTANGFDGQHFLAVHKRQLHEPPLVEWLDGQCMRITFRAGIVGNRVNDRVMRWLSGNEVKVSITAWSGTIITVHSQLGKRTSSMLMLGLDPVDDGTTTVRAMMAMRRSRIPGFDVLRAAVSRWLFRSFLKADAQLLQGIHFRPRTPLPAGEPLQALLEYLDSLPAAR